MMRFKNIMKKTRILIMLMVLFSSAGQVYAEHDSNLDNPGLDDGKQKFIQQGRNTSEKKIPVIITFRNNQTQGLAQAENSHEKIIHDNGGTINHNFHIINGVTAELPEKAIEALSKKKDILIVEPDVEVFAQEQQVTWGIQRVDAPAFHLSAKGSGVKIAILDSGIDYTHPDLNANYRGGFDFVNYDSDPMDDFGHGTKVAGIIAAEDNNIGVLGVAPEASIYGIKVLGSGGSGSVSNVIKGIEWAVDNDMDIISMSLGGPSGTYSCKEAVDNAYRSGVLVIASAGNYGSSSNDNVAYPAKYDSVVAVSAIDQNDNLCSFSSVGPAVELTAPGSRITSTSMGGGYQYFSGTSASAPVVSGVAALIKSADPTLTNDEIREYLKSNAIDLGAIGRDNKFGFGVPIPVVQTPDMNLDITIEDNTVYANQDTPITIHVNNAGTPVSGAFVTVSVSDGTINPASGITDSNGNLVTIYTAPQVGILSTATISATAAKSGYNTDSKSDTITIAPVISTPQLDIQVNTASKTLEPGQDTQVTLHVTSNGNPVSGAFVKLSTLSGNLNPLMGVTDSNGNIVSVYTAPQVSSRTTVTLSAATTKTGYLSGSNTFSVTVIPVSNTILAESRHPYTNYYYKTWVITEPGASQIRVHFSRLDTQAGHDYVKILDKNYKQVSVYSGSYNDEWTPWVSGDTVRIKLITDGSVTDYGFIIDKKEKAGDYPRLESTVIATPGSLESGQSVPVTVHVSSDGVPVIGASIDLSASYGSLYPAAGITDINGNYGATYTAPQVQSPIAITLSADVTKAGYDSDSSSSTFTVEPPAGTLPKLETSIISNSGSVESGQNAQITVHVSSNGSPVYGSIVEMSASAGNLVPVRGITDTNGDFTLTFTAPHIQSPTSVTLSATATKSGYQNGSVRGTIDITPLPSTILIESRHPYPKYYYNTWTISEPGAKRIRLHFSKIGTQAGHDYVYILNRNRMSVIRYDGAHNDVWTPWVGGDSISVKIVSDGSVSGFGFTVDQKDIQK